MPIRRSPTCPNPNAASAPRCFRMGNWWCCRAATTCTWSSPRRWPRRSATSWPATPERRLLPPYLAQLHAEDHALVADVAAEREGGVAHGPGPRLLERQDGGVGRVPRRERPRPAH